MARQHTLSTKVDGKTLERLDALRARMSARAGGVEVTRSAAHERSLLRGMEVLEGEMGIEPQKAKKGAGR
jgi:hypothetical protein